MKKIEVVVIPADSSKPVRGRKIAPTLEAMQKIVGGRIELVPVPDRSASFYCNEEGKLDDLPPNERATALINRFYDGRFRDVLVGDVFICGPGNKAGEDTDIPPSLGGLIFALY